MGDRGDVSTPWSGELNTFEEILLKHNIVTKEQVLLNKGMPEEQVVDVLVKDKLEELGFFDQELPEPPTAQQQAEQASLEELDELEEELDDESFMAEYREKRIAELRAKAKTERFGSVIEISKSQWTREVNDASNECWVIVHLYQTHVENCGVLAACLDQLAAKFKQIKFLKIKATSAVENWKDLDCPALFMYHDGSMQHQLITLRTLRGGQTRADDLEWHLHTMGVLTSDLDGPPPAPGFRMRNLTDRTVGRRAAATEAEDDERAGAAEAEEDVEEYNDHAR